MVLSANGIHAVLGFAITVIALRGLEKETIGVLFPLISLSLMVKQFGDFGLNTPFILFSSKALSERKSIDKIFNYFFWIKFFSGVLTALLGVFFAEEIGEILFSSQSYKEWIQYTSLICIFQFLSVYFQSSLQIMNYFSRLSYSKILPQLFKLAGLLYLYYSSQLFLPQAFFLYMLVPAVVMILSLTKGNLVPIFKKPSWKLNESLFEVGKWIWISMIANAGIGHLDIFMTRAISGSEELALLLAGQRLSSVVPIVTGSFVLVLMPKISSTKNQDEMNYFYRKTLLFAPIIIFFILILFPLSGYITEMLLGKDYANASSLFNIYLLAHSLDFVTTPLALLLLRQKLEKGLALMAFLQLLINFIGNYLFIPLYGATASASVTLFCKIFATGFIFYLLKLSGVTKRGLK